MTKSLLPNHHDSFYFVDFCFQTKQINNSNLAERVAAFLFALMDLAGACSNLVFVYSLASASDTFAEE